MLTASQYYRLPPDQRPKLERPAERWRPADPGDEWHARAKARLAICRTCHHATDNSGPSCALIEAAVADGSIRPGCGGCDGHPVRQAFMSCLLGERDHPAPDACPW